MDNENNQNSNQKGTKRKKKRSANQMAKKFARRKIQDFGNLDLETYQYMLSILEILRTKFQSMDDKLIFANNVYEQASRNELDCVKNKVGSQVLEQLMDYVSLDAIEKLVDALYPSLRPLCSDPYASHVIEKIIETCAERGSKHLSSDPPTIKTEDDSKYNNLALKISKYIINNFEEFIFDNYANQILRTVIRCLNGYFDRKTNKEGSKPEKSTARPVIDDFAKLSESIVNNILSWPRFSELGQEYENEDEYVKMGSLTSGFLQCLLSSLKDTNPTSANLIIRKIMDKCFKPSEDDKLSSIFESEPLIHLLESCLSAADQKTFTLLYTCYFKGNLTKLGRPLQKLLDNCSNEEEFKSMFEEITSDFNSLCKKFPNVIVSLANACLRLKTEQGFFYKSMCSALGVIPKNEKFFPILCRFISCEEYTAIPDEEKKTKVDVKLHGSLIAQAILHFNKPIELIKSILATSSEELCLIFSNPKGSHIVDAFMDSKFVGEKSRISLSKKMQGYWVQLALGIHGSRCVDKFWEYSNDVQKKIIMNELSSAGESMKSSKSGKIIYTKLNVPLYQNNKKEWAESWNKNKTKALFADIIDKKND